LASSLERTLLLFPLIVSLMTQWSQVPIVFQAWGSLPDFLSWGICKRLSFPIFLWQASLSSPCSLPKLVCASSTHIQDPGCTKPYPTLSLPLPFWNCPTRYVSFHFSSFLKNTVSLAPHWTSVTFYLCVYFPLSQCRLSLSVSVQMILSLVNISLSPSVTGTVSTSLAGCLYLEIHAVCTHLCAHFCICLWFSFRLPPSIYTSLSPSLSDSPPPHCPSSLVGLWTLLIDYCPISNPCLITTACSPTGSLTPTWVKPPLFIPSLPSYSSSFPWMTASGTSEPGVGVRSKASRLWDSCTCKVKEREGGNRR
jgi:hypothetical protein